MIVETFKLEVLLSSKEVLKPFIVIYIDVKTLKLLSLKPLQVIHCPLSFIVLKKHLFYVLLFLLCIATTVYVGKFDI